MRWTESPVNSARAASLARKLGVSAPVGRLLWRLGIRNDEQARRFLQPRLRDLDDPFHLAHMRAAVDRVRLAMARQEQITIFGDYDVDGITSCVLLVTILEVFGIRPRYLVPRRLTEGYGLSEAALDRLLEDDPRPDLLIAVDCGTNSRTEIARLRAEGIDVLILDHHTSQDDLPVDAVLVNPHVFDGEDQPWSQLSAVGIVFKFVHALLKDLRDDGDELAHRVQIKDYLELVALGTVADLVPLTQENRILAWHGLRRLCETQRPGLNALIEVAGMTLGDEVTPFDISFRLGPRLNASGRLDDATLPIDMLLGDDWTLCRQTASQLDEFNRERQRIEREIAEEAETLVEEQFRDHPGLVLHGDDWHPGVVGIVASRMVQKYHRPCIVLGSEGEFARGSGRSVHGVNLVAALSPCEHLLDNWGGHPMAVGVSLNQQHLDAFQEAFAASISKLTAGRMPEPEIEIAAWLEPAEVDERLLHELGALQPFGQANPEPIFGLAGVVLRAAPSLFGKGHFRFRLPGAGADHTVWVIGWRQADRLPPTGVALDLAVRLAWNDWNGARTVRATLVHWRPSERH